MANRYWVGGSGQWDQNNTNNWSTTSGGASGASAPTDVDDVFFDANSGTPTVTCSGTSVFGYSDAKCRNFSHAAGTATFTGPGVLVYGGLTFSAGTTYSAQSVYFVAPSGSHTITPAGKTFTQVWVGVPSSTATWTVSGALSCSFVNLGNNAFSYTGTLVLGTSLTANSLLVDSGTTLNLASSTVTLTEYFYVAEGATIASTAPSLTFNPSSPNVFDFTHGGKTYTNATIAVNGERVNFIGVTAQTFTCGSLTRTGAATVYSFLRLVNTNITCTSSISLVGNSLTNRLFVLGVNAQQTLTASTRTLTNVDLRNINGAGGSLPWAAGTSVGNAKNNANITFTPAVTRYARGSGAWDSTAVWSATSGGATGATVPLPQDDVEFNSGSGAINVTTGTRRFLCNNLSISNFVGTLSVNANTASGGVIVNNQIFGNLSLLDSSATISSSDASSLNFTSASTCSILLNNGLSVDTILSSPATTFNLGANLISLNSVSARKGAVSLTSFNGFISVFSAGASFGSSTTVDQYYIDNIPSALSVDLTATSQLRTYDFNAPSVTMVPGTSTVEVTSTPLAPLSNIYGTFYNLNFINNVVDKTILVGFTVTNSFVTTNSTQTANILGQITCTGNGRFRPGTFNVPMVFSSFTLTNNTSFPQETQYAYYASSLVTGTNPELRAFGATNVTNNTGITFPSLIKVAAFTNFSGSWQIPNDFGGSFQLIAVGGGGQAGVQSSGSVQGRGGAGSGNASNNYGIGGVLRNQNIYIQAAGSTGKNLSVGSGANGSESFVNLLNINAVPASLAQGVRGREGLGSSSASGGLSNGGGLGRISSSGGGSSGGSSSFTTTSGGGGGGGLQAFSYGTFPASLSSGGSSFSAGNGGGGGAGTTGSGNNGTASGGGNGGSPNGGLGGTNSPALDGANAGVGGGGGGGGITKSGGNGSNSTSWTYNYLNGVAASGTIGVGGGGAGSGYQSGANRVQGGDGGIGAGGGGVGYYNSATNPYGGSGGPGLVLFVYAPGIEDVSTQLIG